MKEDLKEIMILGLGAMSLTTEKAKELKEELMKKGTEVYNSGKIANEELKRDLKEKMKENVTIVVNEECTTKEDLIERIKTLAPEEKKEVLEVLQKDSNQKNDK